MTDIENAIERAAKSINKAHEYVDGWRSRAESAAFAGNKKVEAYRLDSADFVEEIAASAACLIRAARPVANVRDALAASSSWLERWGQHAGNCAGKPCTCGLEAIRAETAYALASTAE